MGKWSWAGARRSPRCPWCLETIKESGLVSCPHCEGELIDCNGRELRGIDLRYEEVEAEQRQRLHTLLIYGSVVVAALTLVLPMLSIGATIVIPAILAAHMLTLRVYVIRTSLSMLGRIRRVFVRWISRFTFLWIGLPAYSFGGVPILGVAVAVAAFAGLSVGISSYTLWSLRREQQRIALATWEKLLLASLAILTLIALTALIAALLALGWSVTWIIDWVRTNWG